MQNIPFTEHVLCVTAVGQQQTTGMMNVACDDAKTVDEKHAGKIYHQVYSQVKMLDSLPVYMVLFVYRMDISHDAAFVHGGVSLSGQ